MLPDCRATSASSPTNTKPDMPSGQKKATAASSMDRRMCCPRPLLSLANRAAETAWAAVRAVTLSAMMMRNILGRLVSRSA